MPAAFRAVRLARLVSVLLCLASGALAKPDGNRLAYLDGGVDPYYPHRDFARLTTPQWVGEPGVEAVVILSIDDLRDTTPQPLSVGQYEAYLRPILNRLKQIDGRAAVSVMTCRVEPKTPLLQTWLAKHLELQREAQQAVAEANRLIDIERVSAIIGPRNGRDARIGYVVWPTITDTP